MAEGKIYAALAAAMADVEAIGKNKVNSQQGFKFRGIDDVMNALHPILVKHSIFVTPCCLEQTREERETARGTQLIYSIVKVKYSFWTTDGSCVEAVTIGEGMDSGDKATNKAMAIAFKYALFQVFCIATEEMKDPDAETPEPSRRSAKTGNTAAAASQTAKSSTAQDMATKLADLCAKYVINTDWLAQQLYNSRSITEMTYKQLENAIQNIDKVKAKYEEVKTK